MAHYLEPVAFPYLQLTPCSSKYSSLVLDWHQKQAFLALSNRSYRYYTSSTDP